MSIDSPRAFSVRHALKVFFILSFLLFQPFAQGKVYDCFPFYNELELLKIRLDELNDVVDYFVLVESRETQRGNAKSLYFEENKALFAPYLHKIIHVIVDERHPELGLWEREHYQRNCIARGLKKAKKEDIIIISDVDEIIRKNLIPLIEKNLKKRNLDAIAFELKLFRFQLNRTDPTSEPWVGPVATTFKQLGKRKPQYFRDYRGSFYRFKGGGWHFTWMGGRDYIRRKFVSVVEGGDHIEATDEMVDAWIQSIPAVPVDNSFPSYVLRHKDELESLGYIATP